jgi:hypothetical protein
MDSLLGQITDITGIPTDKCITVNIFTPGTVNNVSFDVVYDTLTAGQKTTVDDFRALMVALAPDPDA